ncbi:MAG TPA: hypothetical protein VM008_05825 [Phycisphaerae bacterium]|nr:hypothetical protein [Phycisphaerae bacterium]
MIISLNLPDDVVAFIDQQATDKKVSRSAFIASLLRNMQLVESTAGRQELARTLAAVMVEGALRSGQSIEQVRKAFPRFEELSATKSLPALASVTDDAPQVSPAPPLTDSTHVSIKRRRPYKRASSSHTGRDC